jgi:hypothetical protein
MLASFISISSLINPRIHGLCLILIIEDPAGNTAFCRPCLKQAPVSEVFAADFYLPLHDIYIELVP